MSESNNRMVYALAYPRTVYAQMMVIFFGANLAYHRSVFRVNGNRPQFFMFMLANAFTSYQLAEATNLTVIDKEAAAYNNTIEQAHRAQLNEKLRLGFLKKGSMF